MKSNSYLFAIFAALQSKGLSQQDYFTSTQSFTISALHIQSVPRRSTKDCTFSHEIQQRGGFLNRIIFSTTHKRQSTIPCSNNACESGIHNQYTQLLK